MAKRWQLSIVMLKYQQLRPDHWQGQIHTNTYKYFIQDLKGMTYVEGSEY